MPRSSDRVARLVSTIAGLVLALILGYTAAHFGWVRTSIVQMVAMVFAEPPDTATPGGPQIRPRRLLPQRHRFAGIRTNEPLPADLADDPLSTGVTLLTGYFPETDYNPGVRAIDRQGQIVHSWTTDPGAIWADQLPENSSQVWALRENSVPCGVALLDGDVVVSLHGRGLARVGPDGALRWRLDRMVKGAITEGGDGFLYVPGWNWVRAPAAYPGFGVPLEEDLILKIDPKDGTILKELNLLRSFQADTVRHQQALKYTTGWRTLTGLQEIRPLPAALAADFPGFVAGDLLVTLKAISGIAILDPESGAFKWWHKGAMVYPIAARFLPGGRIAVLDLNKDDTPRGLVLGGSRICSLQPDPAAMDNFGGDPGRDFRHDLPPLGDRRLGAPVARRSTLTKEWFHTNTAGNLQQLPGDRWLLVEADAGRVAEFHTDGRLLWEYAVAPLDSELAAPRAADKQWIYPLQTAVRIPLSAADLQALVR